jgi:hypothetical protein
MTSSYSVVYLREWERMERVGEVRVVVCDVGGSVRCVAWVGKGAVGGGKGAGGGEGGRGAFIFTKAGAKVGMAGRNERWELKVGMEGGNER